MVHPSACVRSPLHHLHRILVPALAVAIGALGPVLSAAEGGDEPAPQVGPDPDALLGEWGSELDVLQEGRRAAADYYHQQGLAALDAGRLDDAIRNLRIAIDYFPGEASFRSDLRRAEAVAGKTSDARGPLADQIGDIVNVEEQRLWIEIQRQIEQGLGYLEQAAYNQAELAFDMARVRTESLPYVNPRRDAELRRIETLLGDTRARRARQELDDRRLAAMTANQREQELARHRQRLERDRIEAMLSRALRARDRRQYDEAILLCEQVLRITRAETRAHDLLVRARRERHAYLRTITADRWDEEHKRLSNRIRRDMLPQLDLVVYPDDWAEIDARRSAPTRGLETAEEAWRADIERYLDQEITVDFAELDIQAVVEFLQRNTRVNIVLDPNAYAGGTTPPVTMQLRNVKLRNALEFILLQTGLRMTLQDEAVYISTEEGLRGSSFTRVYDIRDLTLGLTQFPGPSLTIPEPQGDGARILPEIRQDEQAPTAQDFADLIRQVVATDAWEQEPEVLNGQLVIVQSAAVHRQVEELLRILRTQQAVQINVRVKFLTVENSLLEEIGFNWGNFAGPNGFITPVGAGAVPGTTDTPPWWFGGYWRNENASSVHAGRIGNNLVDYYSNTGLNPTGGARGSLQIFEDPEGFLGRVIVNAVEKTRRGNVLIEPDLTLMSGQRAHLLRMNQQAYIADYDDSGGQYDPVIQVISFGTVLDVLAVASADRRYITMTLRPTDTRITAWRRFGQGTSNFGGENVITTDADGNPLGSISGLFVNYPLFIPELSYTSVQTSVSIPDGGSLMIAGMTTASSSRSHSGVPVLSHIPFLGRLFSANGRTEAELKTLIHVSGDIILFDEIERRL